MEPFIYDSKSIDFLEIDVIDAYHYGYKVAYVFTRPNMVLGIDSDYHTLEGEQVDLFFKWYFKCKDLRGEKRCESNLF